MATDLTPQDERIDIDLGTVPMLSPLAADLLSIRAQAPGAEPRFFKAIETEPVISARMVGLANSVALGPTQGRIRALRPAVHRIGFERALMVAIGLVLGRPLVSHVPPALRLKLWMSALTTAHAARSIAHLRGDAQEPDTAFLLGLFHSLGYMAAARVDADGVARILALGAAGSEATLKAERRRWGADHASLTSRLLHDWGVAGEVVSAVAEHHGEELPAGSLGAVLRDAELMTGSARIAAALNIAADDPAERGIDPPPAAAPQLDPKDRARIETELLQELERIQAMAAQLARA